MDCLVELFEIVLYFMLFAVMLYDKFDSYISFAGKQLPGVAALCLRCWETLLCFLSPECFHGFGAFLLSMMLAVALGFKIAGKP